MTLTLIGLPLFVAVQMYVPSSSFVTFFRTSTLLANFFVTLRGELPLSLLHDISGIGAPSAEQWNDIFWPCNTVRLVGDIVTLGITKYQE